MYRLVITLALMLASSLTIMAQSPSIMRTAGLDQPGSKSVSAQNAFIGAQVTLTLSPEGSPLEEGLLYNALFIKPLWTSPNGRFAIPAVTKFNLNDFDIIDVFDEDGITASAAPYYLLTTNDAPWVIHGALTGSFDVVLAQPSILKGFLGIEKTIPGMLNGLNGSVGVNAHWGPTNQGTSLEFLATIPMSQGAGLLIRATNAHYTGVGRETGMQIGLLATGLN